MPEPIAAVLENVLFPPVLSSLVHEEYIDLFFQKQKRHKDQFCKFLIVKTDKRETIHISFWKELLKVLENNLSNLNVDLRLDFYQEDSITIWICGVWKNQLGI